MSKRSGKNWLNAERCLYHASANKLDNIQSVTEDHSQRLSSLELATDDLSQLVVDLENICCGHKEQFKQQFKVTGEGG